MDGEVRPTEELERFSDRVLRGQAILETVSPFERRIRWEIGDRAGHSQAVMLRSGLSLSLTRLRWERRWTLAFEPEPSRLKLVVVRGPGPRVTPHASRPYELLSGTAQVGRVRKPRDLRFDFEESGVGQWHEELCVEVARDRLCQLAGTEQLPPLIDRVWSSSEGYHFEGLSAPPASLRLLDEIAVCDARGPSRQLYLEAKGLELLATWIDHLESEHAASARLTAHDIRRLEHARQILLARMTAPPHLPELALLAGLNEAKLKLGFRTHFGDSVYGYLRRHRLNQARELLRQGRYNVTEVALRVGYTNPSKFAAAFKAEFGLSPSHVR